MTNFRFQNAARHSNEKNKNFCLNRYKKKHTQLLYKTSAGQTFQSENEIASTWYSSSFLKNVYCFKKIMENIDFEKC
jgi:hypothetical protein